MDSRGLQDQYDVIQAKQEYDDSRPARELNETARRALQANLDYYEAALADLIRSRKAKLDRLEEINSLITINEGHVRDLKEVLGDAERDDSEGVE